MSITFATLATLADSDEPLMRVTTSLGDVDLRLVEVEPLPAPHPGGSLVFRGPQDPELVQGTYPVAAGGDEGLLFLVPISVDGEGRVYQVIFN